MISREFEWFCDPQGQPTTSMGVPYNELFSTEEIRRLNFTRFLAHKNQEPSLLSGESKASEPLRCAANTPMTVTVPLDSWLVLGVKLFCYTPLAMTTLLINCSQLPMRGLWFKDIR